MKIAIMQPYFLPYIGYFQLIASADLFIVYDNIQYTKKGWINRNRMLRNGTDAMFSLPLKKDSDYLDIDKRELSLGFKPNKFLHQIKGAYYRAPYFSAVFPLFEDIVGYDHANLFHFLHYSIVSICRHLDITTEIRISSDIAINHSLKNQDKVLALCEAVGANTYINAIGGMDLYSRETFLEKGLTLTFIQSQPFVYTQFGNEFVPWLSILDVLMFNSKNSVHDYIHANYDLVRNN